MHVAGSGSGGMRILVGGKALSGIIVQPAVVRGLCVR